MDSPISKKALGVIALDIDGTITARTHDLHPDVVSYFSYLYHEGWAFIFITGRPFQWGFEVLQHIPFSYAFAVQNGALTIEMPERALIDRCYLQSAILTPMEMLCRAFRTGFVVYGGFEQDDRCYYCPSHFPLELLAYIEKRTAFLKENWVPVPSFDELPIQQFSSLKCFARQEEAFALSEAIEKQLHLHAPPNRDPFEPSYFVVQATHPQANKGEALRRFMQKIGHAGVVIAAGDDLNDLSMLKQADVKVVMANAPDSLKALADVIAPTAHDNGIIAGLEAAIQKKNEIERRFPK